MEKFDLTNSRTAVNLAAAFVGECQTRTRYLFYSEVAKKEGFPTIEQVFLETADNERGHAEIFYDYLTTCLNDKILVPKVEILIAKSTTANNLLSSAESEFTEATDLYLRYAKEAGNEGFDVIALSFFEIAKIEGRHNKRFLNLLKRYEKNMLFKLPYEVTWECSNCGYRTNSNSAPHICPSCHHKQEYFKPACDDIAKNIEKI